MPTEYRQFPGRVKSALTNPSSGRVTVAVEIDPVLRADRAEIERLVIDGTEVDLVVRRGIMTIGQAKEREKAGVE
jgi:hypothetical protein